MALAKLFGVRGVHVNVPCKGGMRLRATHSAWYLEFYARTFFWNFTHAFSYASRNWKRH